MSYSYPTKGDPSNTYPHEAHQSKASIDHFKRTHLDAASKKSKRRHGLKKIDKKWTPRIAEGKAMKDALSRKAGTNFFGLKRNKKLEHSLMEEKEEHDR